MNKNLEKRLRRLEARPRVAKITREELSGCAPEELQLLHDYMTQQSDEALLRPKLYEMLYRSTGLKPEPRAKFQNTQEASAELYERTLK